MSTMTNIRPLIAKVVRDMLETEDTILDVETVYERLTGDHGDDIFESERELARIAVKQKIKSHLRTAHSVGDSESDKQLSLLSNDAPAALAVKLPSGGFGYVPLRAASIEDVKAATANKVKNIKNASAALERWERYTRPILRIMKQQGVPFGTAEQVHSERLAAKPKRKPKKAAASA